MRKDRSIPGGQDNTGTPAGRAERARGLQGMVQVGGAKGGPSQEAHGIPAVQRPVKVRQSQQ